MQKQSDKPLTMASHLVDMPFPHIEGCPKCDTLDLFPCCGNPRPDGHDMSCVNYDPHFSKVLTRADKLDEIASVLMGDCYQTIRNTYLWLPDLPTLLRTKNAQRLYEQMKRQISDRLTHYVKEV